MEGNFAKVIRKLRSPSHRTKLRRCAVSGKMKDQNAVGCFSISVPSKVSEQKARSGTRANGYETLQPGANMVCERENNSGTVSRLRGCSCVMYEESWGCLIWRREGWKDLIAVFKDLKGIYREVRASLFSRIHSESMRGNSHKLQQGELWLVYRKKLFRVRVVKQWKSCAGASYINDKKLFCSLEWILFK